MWLNSDLGQMKEAPMGMDQKQKSTICVIGGSAAGLASAIFAAREGAKVILIEGNEKLGRKIYATGNGK